MTKLEVIKGGSMVLMFKSAKLAGAEERERNEQLIPPGTDLNTLLFTHIPPTIFFSRRHLEGYQTSQ